MARAPVGPEVGGTPGPHPTRLALIDTVVALLGSSNPEDIRIEDVLSRSGISSGSLYYHFDNFSDLIDQAIISRYAADIEVGIAILDEAVKGATDLASLKAGLRAATARAVGAARAPQRFNRSQVVARAAANQRFRAALVPHQEHFLAAFADLFRQLQAKGLVDPAVDAEASALFVQAYSMGVVLNDVVDHPVAEEAVVDVVMRVLESAFLVDP